MGNSLSSKARPVRGRAERSTGQPVQCFSAWLDGVASAPPNRPLARADFATSDRDHSSSYRPGAGRRRSRYCSRGSAMSSRDRPKRASPTFAPAAQALVIRGRADGPSATARAKPSTKGRIQCRTRVHRAASTRRRGEMDRACSASIEAAALQEIERVHLDGNHGDHLAAPPERGMKASEVGDRATSMRGLIKPLTVNGLAYIDFCSQEIRDRGSPLRRRADDAGLRRRRSVSGLRKGSPASQPLSASSRPTSSRRAALNGGGLRARARAGERSSRIFPGKLSSTLWFMDEARFGQKGRTTHRWWDRGQRPPGVCDKRFAKRIRLALQMPSAASTLAISRAKVRQRMPLGLRMRAPIPPSDPSLRRSLNARLIARSLGLTRCER